MAGRPSKLTPEIADAIVASILEGGYLEPSVIECGVPKSTFMGWMKQGKEDEAKGKTNTPCAEFAWRVQMALAKAENDLIKKLKEEKHQWTRYAWMLERRFRDRWALKKELREN